VEDYQRKEKQNLLPILMKHLLLLIPLNFYAITESEVYSYMKKVGIQHAEIVMCQAKLESANFTSHIFLENNNLLGMKEAKRRSTTAVGTKNNHAYYYRWQLCVIDYLRYQRRFYDGKEDYYEFLLRMGYAESKSYIDKLKQIMFMWWSC
jgi:flagellum-specific peptidoglycan hydrolase FlgJ